MISDAYGTRWVLAVLVHQPLGGGDAMSPLAVPCHRRRWAPMSNCRVKSSANLTHAVSIIRETNRIHYSQLTFSELHD